MMRACKHCGKDFEPRKDTQKFCCPAHRAAWFKAHQGVIPAKINSSAVMADGSLCVVVRVPPEFSDKFHRLPPRRSIDLLEND